MIDRVLSSSPAIRYVAIYRDGVLERRSRPGLADESGDESDRYEEWIVNPALITLARQRGNIDCGGMRYLLIRYGHFFQLVVPEDWGHVSVCIEENADVPAVVALVEGSLNCGNS